MPHCVLEYSDNVIDLINKPAILKEINKTLAGTGLFKIDDIKSRIIVHQDYCVGNGDKNSGFASLSVSIFKGRDIEIRRIISQKCVDCLVPFFKESLQKLTFDITVQIIEIDKDSYLKKTQMA